MDHTLSPDVTDEQFNRIIAIESRGDPTAHPPKGSAGGLGQFLKGTWDDTGKKHYAKQRAKAGASWAAMRIGTKTATIQLLMLARFTEDNVRALGAGWTNGDLYLAHFLGIGDAKKFFHANPNTIAASIVDDTAVNNNESILGRGHSVKWVRDWANASMHSRWDKLGKVDFVKKWYNASDAAAFLGVPVVADDSDDIDDQVDVTPVKPDEVPVPAPRPVTPLPPPVITMPSGTTVKGDPETWWVQSRLTQMHYGPLVLDGKYGGKTSAAIAAFVNDYPPAEASHLTAPKTIDEFMEMRDELKDELSHAEAAGFVRPVTQERKEASPEIVKQVAPEAAPVQRNKNLGLIGIIGSGLTAIGNWFSDNIGGAWNFWVDNKDNIPDGVKDPSTVQSIFDHIAHAPVLVWVGLAFAVFVVIFINSQSGLTKIIDKVKTGET